MVTDGIVNMSVSHEVPDRSALDSEAQVQDGAAVVTCNGYIPYAPKAYAHDPFYEERTLLDARSCGSVQTFRASDASDSIGVRIFLAGIVISAAIGMILEALITGRLDQAGEDGGDDRSTPRR